jgi:hypothetical protein
MSAVRAVVRKNLPKGYKESIGYGMICYTVPLSTHPDTYNGQPLCYAALAAQKNYCALYLMNVYGTRPRRAFRRGSNAGSSTWASRACAKTADDLRSTSSARPLPRR